MRLTKEQILSITQSISRIIGEAADIYLFGSRLDDQAKGGDVDILIETDQPLPFIKRAQIKMELEAKLNLPVDILSQARNMPPTPFQTLVRSKAAKLEVPS